VSTQPQKDKSGKPQDRKTEFEIIDLSDTDLKTKIFSATRLK
jgi:hypothetical protein